MASSDFPYRGASLPKIQAAAADVSAAATAGATIA